jgi:hypothetical protein
MNRWFLFNNMTHSNKKSLDWYMTIVYGTVFITLALSTKLRSFHIKTNVENCSCQLYRIRITRDKMLLQTRTGFMAQWIKALPIDLIKDSGLSSNQTWDNNFFPRCLLKASFKLDFWHKIPHLLFIDII